MREATHATHTASTAQPRRTRKFARRLLVSGLFLALMLAPLFWRELVQFTNTASTYTTDTAPASDVALVFGAAVYGDGRLSSVLRDRMDTAIALYQAGKVSRILVSGDNRADHYDEPGAMRDYAISRGIPAAAVQPDGAGLRTYDTCYRAREIFQVDQAILVTQAFHLPRALFTCRQLGLDVVGVEADQRPYRGARWYEIRETAATMRALWDVLRREPPPALARSDAPAETAWLPVPGMDNRR